MSLSRSPELISAAFEVPSDLNVGPYVDKIVYIPIADSDLRILALQVGYTVMDLTFFDPVHRPTLEADPDIDIYEAPRNGYGHLTINCDKYPLNISGLRRAFAFAFNKTRMTTEIFDGYNTEHDSLVPPTNPWCIEDDLGWHYYTNQSDIGNQILDDLNFTIDAGTGYRLAPDGSAFEIVIEYSSADLIGGEIVQIGVDALYSLHINASTLAGDYNEYRSRVDLHQDYDIVFYSIAFEDFDIDWLAYDYWSDYANEPNQNPTNFRNTTYDGWRSQLLFGETYEEVYEAASEMQKILHDNVPRLVIYVNTSMQGYRTDEFTGHVPDQGRYISGLWTMRKIHERGFAHGGTVLIAVNDDPDSFNFFVSNNPTSNAIFQEIWPSLYSRAPDLTAYPYLAENLLVEKHENNSEVPDGHTRFTIDIIQNATWSDGVSLTAEDVVFTFNYCNESGIYGNPAAIWLGDIHVAYAPTPYRAIIEFSTENYWHFSNFAYRYIIPKHIFNNETGIGYGGWNTWNPLWDPAEPYVTAGPFVMTDFEVGDYYELTVNPDFAFYDPPPSIPVTTPPYPSIPPIVNGRPRFPILLIIELVVLTVILIVVIRNYVRERG
ncbi:MAG: Periplasmic dipeptide transport protein precursor [Candidatus Thorarchaeota archaeon AB_25]|nr:MAG: Periplasmic dipeptide transport protein precursor [Candidatus Thorarchaeota archaeon AB_25]